MSKKYGKPDANHQDMIKYIKAIGGKVKDCKSLINAFDVLVAFRGEYYPIDFKNPEYLSKTLPKNERLEKALTKGERECKELFESAGCNYYIAEDEEDINRILGI